MIFEPNYRHLFIKALTGFTLIIVIPGTSLSKTSTELWQEYVANPYNHANIPNCSYAGYKTGISAIPTVPQVNKITDFGAVGNGSTDNTGAFRRAIADAKAKGGGAVFVPAGIYNVDSMIQINVSGVVLRGEDSSTTVINFTRPLNQFAGSNLDPQGGGVTAWSWSGGLVWIGPTNDVFGSNNKLESTEDWDVNHDNIVAVQEWEYWRPTTQLARVTDTPTRGSFEITVDNVSGLSAGMMVLMTWKLTTNQSFAKQVADHPLMDTYIDQYASTYTWITPPQYPEFQWPVEISSISGSKVRLKQPLRIDIRSEWDVTIKNLGNCVSECGIENVTLRLNNQTEGLHNKYPGWNAVYVNCAYNCWVRNVNILNDENGVILAAAKNVTISGILEHHSKVGHHMLACRVNSHDNLFVNCQFVNDTARVKHGMNTEWFSSGNVWSKIALKGRGTFDSHLALSFDGIRTECSAANDKDCAAGGATAAGPYLGKRFVHWNVLYDPPTAANVNTTPGRFLFQPEAHPHGALVGVRGVPLVLGNLWYMPTGDKGCIVADSGITPSIVNLYETQLTLRKQLEGSAIQRPSIATKTEDNQPVALSLSGLELAIDAKGHHIVQAKIFSLSGQLVDQYKGDNSQKMNIDVTNISRGNYLVSILMDDREVVQKVWIGK